MAIPTIYADGMELQDQVPVDIHEVCTVYLTRDIQWQSKKFHFFKAVPFQIYLSRFTGRFLPFLYFFKQEPDRIIGVSNGSTAIYVEHELEVL